MNRYVWSSDQSHKYKLFTEEYVGKDKDGKNEVRQRQVLIYWNKAEADMTRKVADPETGELEAVGKKAIRSVNLEKAESDARFDGYFCLITSEMEYNAAKIREVYGGLWKIEQSFRIMKSDLEARPVNVSTKEHIRAHFLICFVALLIVRLVQHAMGKEALSVERMTAALVAANCKIKRGGFVELDDVGGSRAFVKRKNKKDEWVDTLMFSDKDQIAGDYQLIQKAFGTDYYDVDVKQEAFGRFLKKISLKL